MEIKNISPLLKKKPWKRLVSVDADVPHITDSIYYDIPRSDPSGLRYQYLSNADLINESSEEARDINNKYYSLRPLYEPTEVEVSETDEHGNITKKKVKKWVITGYDKVETVRSGLGEMIIKQKASHLAKNGIETADEGGGDHKRYDDFRAWKDISGVDSAWVDVVYAAGKAGDAAMYIYQHGRSIEYTVFSPLRGDMLFPHKDDKGNDMLVRMYQLNGKTAVDIFTVDFIETWVCADLSDKTADGTENWFDKIKGWFRNLSPAISEDGWERISHTPSQLDEYTCQVAYLRFDDSFIGLAMQNINAWERGASYVSDKVKSMAFSKLLLKATRIKSVPTLSSGEEVIAIDGTADDLKASTAEYLTPPDISNIATLDLKTKFDAIMQSTMSIDLQPEILKSGADSSQTLKLLMRREIQWCHVMWPQVRPVAKHVIEILKGLVAKIEGDGKYKELKLSVWNTPWIPQDEDALADRVTKLIYAGVLSQENGRHELNMQYTDDTELIRKEAEDKIYRETYIKLKAESQARKDFGLEQTANDIVVDQVDDNPAKNEAKPKIDNNAPNKNISDR